MNGKPLYKDIENFDKRLTLLEKKSSTRKYFESDNIDELYKAVIEEVTTRPEYTVSPRGMDIKEITNTTLVLTNPRKCLVTNSARKMNYAFAVMEKMQYLTGDSEPNRLGFYNSNFMNYRNKYGFFDGDYGPRMQYWLPYIYNLLKVDPDSRQAVMTIYGVQDRHETKDVPCTIMHHYMLRNGKLNLTVYMRSCDILWGLPYDANGFCFIQEFMAAALGVEMGTYTHIVGSLHSYNEREDQLKRVLDSNDYLNIKNPVIQQDTYEKLMHKFKHLLDLEYDYRVDNTLSKMSCECTQQYFDILKEAIDRKNAKV
jgi:thymidylate synthase